MDFLAKTIGSFTGSSFPFNIGERFDNESNYPSVWAIHSGTLKVSIIIIHEKKGF